MAKQTKKTTFVSFLLDETGSMDSVKDATISGFNEYIQTLKDRLKDQDVKFTLVKFNSDKYEVVCFNAPLNSVPKLGEDNYTPSAVTPLVDSACRLIKGTLSEAKEGKDTIQIILQTDGYENASREYTNEILHSLVKQVQDAGGSVVFLGADIDAYSVAGKWGVDAGSTMSYNKAATADTFRSTARSTVTMASTGSAKSARFTDEEKEKSET